MKKILCMLLVAGMVTTAMAVPATREAIVMTAPDGTEKVVFMNGDESFHFLTDEEGNWLDEATLLPLSEDVKAARTKVGAARVQARRVQQAKQARLLAPKGPVILVNFSDISFRSQNSHEAMTDWAMGDNYTYNGATGSIHQYFMDQSWGQFDMQIDVIGPVTVSNTRDYYGEDGSDEGDDMHPDQMVVEACQIAHDSLGVDFSQYDSNNDGKVDWVVIIYAGKGQADGGGANTIWPHQADLGDLRGITLDGKKVNHYCCLNEIKSGGTRCGIGTFCHEYSHIMGLPDFYDTQYSDGHKTMGSWDIMDAGPYNNNGNTPPSYSAYERWWMGWMNPKLLNSACSVVLPNLSDSRSACYITTTGSAINNVRSPGSSAFYIIENRQKTCWDKYIPGHGMIVTKIKYSSSKWNYNTVNNDKSNMGVDLIEADGKAPTNSSGKAGDAYPAGSKQFTDVAKYQITNIAETAMDGYTTKVITFDVNGGGSKVTLDIDQLAEEGTAAQKILHNGRVLIIRGGIVYDLNGQRIQ